MPYGANATGPDGPARRLREHGRADFADIETLHLARDHRMSYTPAMIVDIVSDVVCPWCYIGKRRFEQALAARPAFAVTTAWRAFQLNPDMPAEGMERQGYLADKFGSAARAASIYADITEAGLREDIAFAFDRILRTPNTILAHRLIRLSAAHGVQDAVVEALFRRYFEDGADIGNAEQPASSRSAPRQAWTPKRRGRTSPRTTASTRSGPRTSTRAASASTACPASSSTSATPSPAPRPPRSSNASSTPSIRPARPSSARAQAPFRAISASSPSTPRTPLRRVSTSLQSPGTTRL